ncbi:MAG: hypothetical protein WAK33_05355 [Silvibacterium sp.]
MKTKPSPYTEIFGGGPADMVRMCGIGTLNQDYRAGSKRENSIKKSNLANFSYLSMQSRRLEPAATAVLLLSAILKASDCPPG